MWKTQNGVYSPCLRLKSPCLGSLGGSDPGVASPPSSFSRICKKMGNRNKISTGIDPESARKILDADLKNIVSKVASGKPLTARERKTVESAGKEIQTARSVGELQTLLGLTRAAYYRLKKIDGSPTGLVLEEWREFQARARLSTVNGEPLTPDQVAGLRVRLLKERTGREKVERKLKELRLEREEGGWIPFEEAETAITRVLEPLNRLIEGVPKKYALRVNPKDPEYAEEMLREMVNEIKEGLSSSRGKNISKRKGIK